MVKGNPDCVPNPSVPNSGTLTMFNSVNFKYFARDAIEKAYDLCKKDLNYEEMILEIAESQIICPAPCNFNLKFSNYRWSHTVTRRVWRKYVWGLIRIPRLSGFVSAELIVDWTMTCE